MANITDHQRRWLTGVVGLAAVLLVVGYGSTPIFFLFLMSVTVQVLREYYDLSSACPGDKLVGCVLGASLLAGFYAFETTAIIGILTGIGFVLCLLSLVHFHNEETSAPVFEGQAVGIFVVALFLAHYVGIRDLEEGKRWIFFLLSVVFAGDTCAFFGGRAWGRHKLAPRISPGKTVEGSILGLIGSSSAGCAFALVFLPGVPIESAFVMSVLLGFLGQLGDLWESTLKRRARVKDSGKLLPGHGGFLDRVDSLLFTGPALYYLIVLLTGIP